MSLLLIYNDDFVTDRQCVVEFPHAEGQAYLAKKLQVSADQTFAFAAAGPTQSEKEKNILEAILLESFKLSPPNSEFVELEHDEWFEARSGISLMVMTRGSTYWGYFPNDKKKDPLNNKPPVPYSETNYLVRVSPDIPIVYGTGGQVASMAVLEGVKVQDLTILVADIVYTVSPEYDHVHRSSLKEMTHE